MKYHFVLRLARVLPYLPYGPIPLSQLVRSKNPLCIVRLLRPLREAGTSHFPLWLSVMV